MHPKDGSLEHCRSSRICTNALRNPVAHRAALGLISVPHKGHQARQLPKGTCLDPCLSFRSPSAVQTRHRADHLRGPFLRPLLTPSPEAAHAYRRDGFLHSVLTSGSRGELRPTSCSLFLPPAEPAHNLTPMHGNQNLISWVTLTTKGRHSC